MIPVILGLGSRYSYLAATQLPDIEASFGVTFDWWPVHSPDLIRAAHGSSPIEAARLTGQYAPDYRDRDARRWAELYGVPYRPPAAGLEFRAMAKACWGYAEPARRRSMALRVMQAIFAEGQVPDSDLLAALARETGAPDQDGAAAHKAAVERCLAWGVFGVPSVVAGGEVFWGNDRLVLLRHHLGRESGHE